VMRPHPAVFDRRPLRKREVFRAKRWGSKFARTPCTFALQRFRFGQLRFRLGLIRVRRDRRRTEPSVFLWSEPIRILRSAGCVRVLQEPFTALL
jgi:hypothetical protein